MGVLEAEREEESSETSAEIESRGISTVRIVSYLKNRKEKHGR
jgi:hypothetical protein